MKASKAFKVFRDPIYGYIHIPDNYCKDFIDNEIFQRLKRIEQTSMRVVYPSAHHDRFSHSIGVYYLGKLAFDNLERNSKQYLNFLNNEDWEIYKITFEIACLLHDCGHSPFSHTFEYLYLYQKDNIIREEFIRHFGENVISNDYDMCSPADHEKISAMLVLNVFSEKIKKYQVNPLLVARMIMGCKHEDSPDKKQRFENKLISLLNGSSIDVDSLDYIQRDTWASGVSNVEIDFNRFLSSLMIKIDDKENPQIVFKKNALSVLDYICSGRNFLYKWIYSHHKVKYEQYLLTKIIDNLNSITKNELSNKLFTYEAFISPQKFEDLTFFLPSDDDVLYLLKKYKDKDNRINEYLSRNHEYKALWKTDFEFKSIFDSVSSDNIMNIQTKIGKNGLKGFNKDDILLIKATPKLKGINANDFYIEINDKLFDASTAVDNEKKNNDYFIVYVKKEIEEKKEQIIKEILSLQS